MTSLLHMFLLICCLFHSGVSQNSITCPRPFYKEGSSASQLTIDSSTFGGCDTGPTSVTCRWYPKTGTERVICVQSVTSCDQAVTSRGCRCDSVNGQIYKYSLSFSMVPGEEKGNISCSLDCVVLPPSPGPKATVDSDQTCQNINFVSKCETFGCQHGVCRINGTEPICDCTGTEYKGNRCEERLDVVQDRTNAVIVAVIAAVIAILLLIFVSVYTIKLYRHQHTSLVCHLYLEDDFLTHPEGKEKLCNFIRKNATCCCCAIKAEGNVDNRGDREVIITVTSKLIWSLCLLGLPAKVKEFIGTEFMKESKRPVYSNEPAVDYPPGPPMSQPKYNGKGNGQPKKSKSDKEIPLSTVGRSSPPSETSGDEKTRMIPTTKARALPVPANQHEPTSIGIGKSASPRLDPLKQDHSKMTSVERNSGAFSRELPSPVRSPLGPIPSGKQS